MAGASDVLGSTLRIGRKTYAVGLIWNTIELAENAAAEARATAARDGVNADFFCVRRGSNPQYGLGTKDGGHAAGMPALAACLADANVSVSNWIAAFRTEDGWYLIAVRDDAVFSELDRIYASEEDAKARFAELLDFGGWDQRIAPAAWAHEDSTERALAEFLRKRPSVRLQPVAAGARRALVLGAAVLLLGAAGIGLWQYKATLDAERDAELRRALASVVQPRQAAPVRVAPPWESAPLPSAFLAACVAGAKELPIDVPGFRLAFVSCDGKSVAGTFEAIKLEGTGAPTLNWINDWLKRNGRGLSQALPLDGQPGRAVVGSATRGLKARPPAEAGAMKEAKRYLTAQLTEAFIEPSFAQPVRPTPPAPQPGQPAPPPQDMFASMKFAFASGVEPTAFVRTLDAVSGLVVLKAVYDVAKWSWQIEGEVYERIPAQPQPR